jgi:hypothetical protein
MPDPTVDDSTPLALRNGCGAPLPGGTEGCWNLFHQVVALEYSDPAFGAVNL